MPGYTVGEIHDAMTAAAQWSGPLRAYITLASGPLLAIAALIAAARASRPLRHLDRDRLPRAHRARAPGYFWASFDIGMGMADTFPINGGDYSPCAAPLYALSFAALVALIIVGASDLRARRTRPHVGGAGAGG